MKVPAAFGVIFCLLFALILGASSGNTDFEIVAAIYHVGCAIMAAFAFAFVCLST